MLTTLHAFSHLSLPIPCEWTPILFILQLKKNKNPKKQKTGFKREGNLFKVTQLGGERGNFNGSVYA